MSTHRWLTIMPSLGRPSYECQGRRKDRRISIVWRLIVGKVLSSAETRSRRLGTSTSVSLMPRLRCGSLHHSLRSVAPHRVRRRAHSLDRDSDLAAATVRLIHLCRLRSGRPKLNARKRDDSHAQPLRPVSRRPPRPVTLSSRPDPPV
jgi:hypothetical protein